MKSNKIGRFLLGMAFSVLLLGGMKSEVKAER